MAPPTFSASPPHSHASASTCVSMKTVFVSYSKCVINVLKVSCEFCESNIITVMLFSCDFCSGNERFI